MAVLYRKYRPQSFSDVLNQSHIIRTLKNQVISGQVSHAYLFTGSRGVGKTSVARIMAKAVNCPNTKAGEPCGVCSTCEQVSKNNFLDLVEIDAASNTGVDNIRDLIDHVRFSPSVGKFKVFIIDEVHMLSKGAFNALLKTLEEPPAHAIFILATTEINKVPATIISRTQRFDFKRYNTEDLKPHLQKILKQEKFKMHPEIIDLVAQNADGSVRDSLTILEKVMTLGEDATPEECRQLLGITDTVLCRQLLDFILQGKGAEIPDFFNLLLEKGADFTIFNRDFLEYLRKVLISAVTDGKLQEKNIYGGESVKHQSEQGTVMDFIFIIRLFLRAYKDLSSAPRAEIPMLLASLEGAARKAVPARPIAPAAPTLISRQEPAKPLQAPFEVSHAVPHVPPQDYIPAESGVVESGESLVDQEVKAWWPQVIAEIKKQNTPLANLIRTSTLSEVRGNAIILEVKFPFHKQNIENQKNQQMIRLVIEQLSGKKASVRANVVKHEQSSHVDTSAVLGDALKIFGGELVE